MGPWVYQKLTTDPAMGGKYTNDQFISFLYACAKAEQCLLVSDFEDLWKLHVNVYISSAYKCIRLLSN